ncbi:MAG: glycosyltransferase family 4 protein [Candidatus Hydrogenedentes bacterium]|nr:glycosyltransferase family 4 protein [Candidatus Hydrogenedentota bacterium]
MLRILVLCARDWRHPRAAGVEHYTHEVFSRIARQGHYVAWLCQNHGGLPFARSRVQNIESVDGIQVARLGSRVLYRPMVGLFFSRLSKPGEAVRQFDVVVDCVNGRPFPVGKYTATPVVPIVFNLATSLQASSDSPGPVIAPSEEAFRQLRDAGIPKRCIIRVPFAPAPLEDSTEERESTRTRLLAFSRTSQPLGRALKRMRRRGLSPEIDAFGVHGGRHAARGAGVSDDAEALARARVAYCGEGFEWRALTLSAHGIPCVCPHTAAGREYVEHGKTGFLHRPRDASHLADLLETLFTDDLQYKRIARAASGHGGQDSWDRSASLVLAALENLCVAPAPEHLATV